MPFRCKPALLAFAFLLGVSLAAQDHSALQGEIYDRNDHPIANASVTIVGAGVSTRTDSNGRFKFGDGRRENVVLEISAPGWATIRVQVDVGDGARRFYLFPTLVEQRVTVVGDGSTRSVTEFNAKELISSPALDLDTRLRQVPGFTLFRRTPSWSANPTTQGVSLRGAGASGTSRAVVVLNGFPLNDPFGGWVYWGRVSPETIDNVVVTQGGASDLFGTQALGGAVELTRMQPTEAHLTASSSIGNLFTPTAALAGDVKVAGWWLDSAGSLFRSNGYVPTAHAERGAIDTVANSENASGWLQADRELRSGDRFYVGGNLYGESRQNGTYLQFNSATVRELRSGIDLQKIGGGELNARLYGGTENLRQTFSAIAIDRDSETLTRDQSVPVNQVGANVLWTRSIGSRQVTLIGAETTRIEGASEEWAYFQGTRTSRILSGGSQRRVAGFAEDNIQLNSKILLSAAIRLDHWANYEGSTRMLPLNTSQAPAETKYPDRSETFAAPRVGIHYSPVSSLTLKASASRAFRAPTLNELYRTFRVGNVLTLNNAMLGPERQTGLEAGATYALSDSQKVDATYFWSRIEDPVSNVTLSSTAALITRQRQNLGRLQSEGAELSWNARWSQLVSTSLGYQFANSKVDSFPSDPTLVGRWIPQVPRHNATAQLLLERPNDYTVVLGGRYQGMQFDDDRNLFPLGSYFVAAAYASKNVRRRVQVFAGIENLLNRRYAVGRTPVTTVGPPILGRVGVRFRLGER